MTQQSILLCPFAKQANKTLLYSYLANLKKDKRIELNSKRIKILSKKLLISTSTLKRHLNSLKENNIFSIKKIPNGYEITRYKTKISYLSISIDINFVLQHKLSTAELIIFSSILILQKKGKGALNRKSIACRTGFSLRQVSYILSSLEKKEIIEKDKQLEWYVRKTKQGIVKDTRNRKVSVIPKSLENSMCFKIAPLKEELDNPVNTNGFNQSDCKEIINYFNQTFSSTTVSLKHLQGCLNKQTTLTLNQIKKAINQAKQTPFLKTAYKFGWQEAVISSYQTQKARIWERSKHITSYTNKKLGLIWIIRNSAKILSGVFNPKPISSTAQKQWRDPEGKGGENTLQSPTQVKKDLLQKQEEEEKIQENIQLNKAYQEEERGIRLKLLQKLGGSIYKAWFEEAKIQLKNNRLQVIGRNPFIQDRLDTYMIPMRETLI